MQTRSLVNRNKQGKSDERVEEMVPKLYRYCYFLTKNKWDGEDLAQESICKALSHYPNRLNWSSSLLNKMAYHLWIDKVRKQGRETIGPVLELMTEGSQGEGVHIDTIEMLSRKMTPKQLITFVLKEAFQYKIAEIAELLNMTETSVKALLNRSRARVDKLSMDEGANVVQAFWEEGLQKELNAILYRSLKAQDPSLLLAYIPTLITSGSVHMHIGYTSASPSNVLSMAA